MIRYDLIVIGAGPAGLSAAIEGAKAGMRTVVFDENERPGGQLFKQIHKFFGSKEHKAKIRGINIGEKLLREAEEVGVEVNLSSTVIGIYPEKCISVNRGDHIENFRAETIIVATGAAEKMIPFKGWDLPGVMGAGAAQTMMNLHGVMPGKKILMLGTGNVGLVVSFQLLQAGCEVTALVDAAKRVGGYGVHAAKVARTGVPFYLSHTIVEAKGTDHVESVVIAEVDERFQPIPGTEVELETDTICVAVGLNPMSQLVRMTGCRMKEQGGLVPECDEYGATSIKGIYAAGDVSGIEEASSAMIEGHITGLAAARHAGWIEEDEFEEKVNIQLQSLDKLRHGMFAPQNKGKTPETTDEGIPMAKSLLQKGYMDLSEVERYPGIVRKAGVHPVIECSQNIPCDPCQDACPFGCIRVGNHITDLPAVVPESVCKNCGACVAACPGQAIFLVDEDAGEGYGTVSLPYEFLPIPSAGDRGKALDRSGSAVCDAEVLNVKDLKAYDKTAVLTIKVPKEHAMEARFFRKEAR
ncbi:MAG: FAD-dependent oxidoreductase [Firmicutes bacterium]|nr:FAD-dependent oxidoreductase [Bacillota bacterium]